MLAICDLETIFLCLITDKRDQTNEFLVWTAEELLVIRQFCLLLKN